MAHCAMLVAAREPIPVQAESRSMPQRVPQEHPLRAIRTMVDEVLQRMSPQFDILESERRSLLWQ
jgi:hypothetical protein